MAVESGKTVLNTMRVGPLPGAIYVHRLTREVHSVLTPAVSASGLRPCVVHRDARGVVWVTDLDEFHSRYEPAKVE